MKETKPSGWVYVLRNASMPGKVKIGSTTGKAQERADALSDATGVPEPFYVVKSWRTDFPPEAEREVHEKLYYFRVNRRREFFAFEAIDGVRSPTEPEVDEFLRIVIENAIEEVALRKEREAALHAVGKALWVDEDAIQQDGAQVVLRRECEAAREAVFGALQGKKWDTETRHRARLFDFLSKLHKNHAGDPGEPRGCVQQGTPDTAREQDDSE